jgi:hypothetical protein
VSTLHYIPQFLQCFLFCVGHPAGALTCMIFRVPLRVVWAEPKVSLVDRTGMGIFFSAVLLLCRLGTGVTLETVR